MSQKSTSEYLFEKFCYLNELPCEKIEESSTQRPDYRVRISGQDFIIEIKQFDPNKKEKEVIDKINQGDHMAFSINPGERIRKAIHKANSQLKQLSNGKIPALLVVYDNITHAPFWDHPNEYHTNEYCVMTAMKGVDTIPISVPKDPKQSMTFGEVVSGGKRELRSDANTTISAIAVLKRFADDDIRLDVYHNPFAAVPIEPMLLRINNVNQFRLPKDSKNSLDKTWELI